MNNTGISNLKDLVAKDVWTAIKDNYERGSYTSAITNLIQFINEIIQDKSNLESVDNTSLIEQAFSFKPGKSPKIQVNRLQTRTEKDTQEGIMYLLKGACLAIRNPRSHDRFNDNKLTTDRIILFYDYVLTFVRDSEQPKLVDDWLEFIFDKNFVTSKEYAEETFKQIPSKKRYDLLVSLFRNREKGLPNKLNYLVDLLLNSLSTSEYNEFLRGINKELITCDNDTKLNMFFDLFPASKWDDLENLVRLRVEAIVLKSIVNAEIVHEGDPYGNYYWHGISDQGMLAVKAKLHFSKFKNMCEIINAINENCRKNKDLFEDYFIEYFSEYINMDIENEVSDKQPEAEEPLNQDTNVDLPF